MSGSDHPGPAPRDLLIPAGALLLILGLAFSRADLLPTFEDPVVDTWPTLDEGESAILFVGDNLLGDASVRWMKQEGDDWQFRKLEPLLRSAHSAAVVGNQEGPVTRVNKRRKPNTVYNYKQPPRTMALFHREGITHLSVANNHALDRGLQGLKDTIKHAREAGITPFGGGTSQRAARRPVFIQAGDTKVAILGGAQNWGSLRRSGWEAKGDKGGIFLLRDGPAAQMTRAAKAAADVVVWYPHWGDNYRPVRPGQRALAETLIQAGADAIVGQHSHDAQSFGWVGGKPVAWSLGNFVFGTPGRFGPDKYGDGWGLMARMIFRAGAIVRLELVPIEINNRINQYQPHPLRASRSREVLKMLARREGTPLRLAGGVGILEARPPE